MTIVVAQRRRNVTLYVHCRSAYLIRFTGLSNQDAIVVIISRYL